MNSAYSAPVSNLSRRQWLLKSVAAASGLTLAKAYASAASDNGIVRTAEAIHQEVIFKTTASRIYRALTDASQFQKVELLSTAMKSLDLKSHPAAISTEPGGTFSLFGNYIVGRQIELVPNQRIVQAWRVASWAAGVYSLVKFDFSEQDSTTKIVFDHVGFPSGTAEHLAAGWYEHYWDPLRQFFA
jgi:activator of HSP90 ATPase